MLKASHDFLMRSGSLKLYAFWYWSETDHAGRKIFSRLRQGLISVLRAFDEVIPILLIIF